MHLKTDDLIHSSLCLWTEQSRTDVKQEAAASCTRALMVSFYMIGIDADAFDQSSTSPLNETKQGLMPDDRECALFRLEPHEMIHQSIHLWAIYVVRELSDNLSDKWQGCTPNLCAQICLSV